jgi:PKHD-type hydroxylase
MAMWELFPDGLPAEYCDRLIARAQELPANDGTLGIAAKGLPDVRRSKVRWLDVAGQDFTIANDIMFLVRIANRQSFGFDIVGPDAAQFTEYHASEGGKYDWHQDISWESTAPYYEGGDFEFFRIPSPGAEMRKRGAVLVFPSFLQHRVTPVTAGVRQSLVSWIEGPKFR